VAARPALISRSARAAAFALKLRQLAPARRLASFGPTAKTLSLAQQVLIGSRHDLDR
jgi:hypothetical protein